MPRRVRATTRLPRGPRVVAIAIPALVIVVLGRSCGASSPTDPADERPARLLVDETFASPGVGTPNERADIRANLRGRPVVAFLPDEPSPDAALQGPGRVRVEEFADTSTFQYSIGTGPNPGLTAVISTETRICQPQSAIKWSTAAVGSGDGCIAANPSGGFFVEWIDRSAKPAIGVHVESMTTDENRLLAWLSTWKRQPS